MSSHVVQLALCAALVYGSAAQHVSSYSNYYQPSGPSYPSAAGSDYYNYRRPSASQGIMSSLQGIFQGFSDRKFEPAFLGPIGAILGLVFVVAVVGYGVYILSELNSSGRGLDSDEWEVDHSVWMDQLQKDFEGSWTTE